MKVQHSTEKKGKKKKKVKRDSGLDAIYDSNIYAYAV